MTRNMCKEFSGLNQIFVHFQLHIYKDVVTLDTTFLRQGSLVFNTY